MSLVIETPQTGFVVTGRAGRLEVRSAHPLVRQVLKLGEAGAAEFEPRALRESLSELTRSPFEVVHLSRENASLGAELVRAELRGMADGKYFVKDKDGSRGNQVLKVRTEQGEVVEAYIPRLQQEILRRRLESP